MSGRKLNALEQKIHQAAISASDKKITQKEVDALSHDLSARTAALNFLLGSGLLKVLKGDDGKLLYRGVVKEELDVKKGLNNEESLVLSHIQAAGTEGIWTKHIKAKTELHQTVIDRCLKSLTQKQLVKALKGTVQHPTRKMYILFHLEPSTEVTGGPWYTDKELDTEFIKLLSAACLKFIRDRSFPRSKGGDGQQRLLYPISSAPPYPTAVQVQTFLNKSRITETQLTVEHVEMLLNVLVIDGEVEKVPALGATLWEANLEDENEESSEEENTKSKKRKRSDDDLKRKKKRLKTHSSDEEESDSDDAHSKKSKSKSKAKKSKHKAKKRRRDDSDVESDVESEDDERARKRNKRKKRKSSKDSESEKDEPESEEVSDEDARNKKFKGKGKKRSRSATPSSSSSETESEPEPSPRAKSRSKSKKHSSSPGPAYDDSALGGALVYRAIHPERMANFGLSQAPCGRCPVFEFCKDKGPVNPGECVYYADWLNTAAVKME